MKAALRSIVSKFLRRVATLVGGTLLSQQMYNQLLTQRARAVSELVVLEKIGLKPGLTGVVLSKDRALQLYTLLYTYFKLVENPASLFIIYSASTESHARAYSEVVTMLEKVTVKLTFVRETMSFRETLLKILAQVNTKNIFFLVDDIIFIRPLNLKVASEIDPLQSILSFRHSPHLRRSYTAAVDQAPPNFVPAPYGTDVLTFKWFEQGNEWADPWSLDGQILSTAEVRVLTRLSDFKSPNSYEGALKTFSDIVKNRSGICYGESKIVNLPINRVQSEVPNYSGSISPEFLLEQWNKGLMLDTSMFETHVPRSTHEEHPVSFKKRGSFPVALSHPSSRLT
jgi:hypothetical protein